jgi:preprotein translocase subunit YajC
MSLLPLVLIFVVFYFLLIRPQQKKMQAHRAMIGAVKRGDKVVTAGGVIGTVAKVDDAELLVEIAKDVRIKVVKGTLSEVIDKTAQAKPANDTSSAAGEPKGGLMSQLFGKR